MASSTINPGRQPKSGRPGASDAKSPAASSGTGRSAAARSRGSAAPEGEVRLLLKKAA